MNDIAPSPGYSSLHVPRPLVSGGASRGGGLSVIFRAFCHHTPSSTGRQFLSVDVLIRVVLLTLSSISTDHRGYHIAFVDELDDVITLFAASCADNIVIIGDLRAPGVDGSHINDELATLFESFGMTQFVDSPTR